MDYKLCFFVPQQDCDAVKQALFAAGAGTIGNYDNCCWQVLGQGQFRPLAGSNPHLGQLQRLEVVVEYKVEMVVESAVIRAVVAALKQHHPYEEPAYDVVALLDF